MKASASGTSFIADPWDANTSVPAARDGSSPILAPSRAHFGAALRPAAAGGALPESISGAAAGFPAGGAAQDVESELFGFVKGAASVTPEPLVRYSPACRRISESITRQVAFLAGDRPDDGPHDVLRDPQIADQARIEIRRRPADRHPAHLKLDEPGQHRVLDRLAVLQALALDPTSRRR